MNAEEQTLLWVVGFLGIVAIFVIGCVCGVYMERMNKKSIGKDSFNTTETKQ